MPCGQQNLLWARVLGNAGRGSTDVCLDHVVDTNSTAAVVAAGSSYTDIEETTAARLDVRKTMFPTLEQHPKSRCQGLYMPPTLRAL
jgi:hypothetical protein